MITRKQINEFLFKQNIAIAGVSRKDQKFGNTIFRDLKKKGYRVFPVNPQLKTFDELVCYPSLTAIPEKVDGVVIVVSPSQTESIVRNAVEAGIRHIWMQQGAESADALQFCHENGIQAISGQCILMFAEPSSFMHRIHRWIWGMLGKIPK